MKFVKFLDNYSLVTESSRWLNPLIGGNIHWKYLRELSKNPLPKNQFYAACLEMRDIDKPVTQSLVCTSEKRVYLTKDCSKRLVASHTNWNCIVEVEPHDNPYYINC